MKRSTARGAGRPEAEARAYAEGFTGTARLFARIADLQKALGDATAEIETLKDEICALESRLADVTGG